MTRSLTRSLLKGLIWMTLVGVAFVYVATNHVSTRTADDQPTYPQQVVAANHCVKPAPGTLPSGAVITMKSWVAAQYTEDTALIGQAMEHAINHVDNDVYSVTAFCA